MNKFSFYLLIFVLLATIISYNFFSPVAIMINQLLNTNYEINKIMTGTVVGLFFMLLLSILIPLLISKSNKNNNEIPEKVNKRLLESLDLKDETIAEQEKKLKNSEEKYIELIKSISTNKEDIEIQNSLNNADFEKTEELLLLKLNNQNIQKAKTYFQLGDISYLRTQYDDSINYYKEGLKLDKENIYYLIQIAETYGRKGDYLEKIKLLLDLLNKLDKDSTIKDYWILGNIGDAYNYIGKSTNSIIYLKKALKSYTKININNMRFELLINRDLTKAYYLDGDYDKSLKHNQKAISIQSNYFKEDTSLLSDLYSLLSATYSMKGLYQEAITYAEKVIESRTKKYGVNSCAVASSYTSLGRILSNKNENQKAIDITLVALNIFTNLNQCSLSSVSVCNNYIGYYYIHLELPDKAIKYLNDSLEINKEIYQEDNIYDASNYAHLGSAYSLKDDFKKGLKYLLKSLEIRINLLPINHPDIASTYANLGVLYSRNNDFENALINFKLAYQIYKDNFGEKNPNCLSVLSNINMVYNMNIDVINHKEE